MAGLPTTSKAAGTNANLTANNKVASNRIIPAIPSLAAINRTSKVRKEDIEQLARQLSTMSMGTRDMRHLSMVPTKTIAASSKIRTDNLDRNAYLAPRSAATKSVKINSTKRRTVPAKTVRKYKMHLGPLTEFALFPKLPIELQIKIWEFSFTEPRLIELEYGTANSNVDYDGPNMARPDHNAHAVCPQSNSIPAGVLVTKSVRLEALKFYQMTDIFNSPRRGSAPRPVYYNEEADIIYFGDHTCMGTIVALTNTLQENGMRAPRIAVRVTGSIYHCGCNWKEVTGINTTRAPRVLDVGHQLMRVFHGITYDLLPDQKPILGFPGIQEVFFVMPSNLWKRGPGEINARTGYRPAVGNGLTVGQIKLNDGLLKQIKNVEERGGILDVGNNKWDGGNKPAFHFVSLAPRRDGATDLLYDSMTLSFSQVNKLSYRNWVFLNDLQRSAGVDIVVGERGGHLRQEVGFHGNRASIDNAIVAIKERSRHPN